jgi:hypothetical protein
MKRILYSIIGITCLSTFIISCAKEEADNSIGYEGEYNVTGQTGKATTRYAGNEYWGGMGSPTLTGKVILGEGQITFNNLALTSSHIGYYQDYFNTVTIHTELKPLNGSYSFTKVSEDSISIQGLTLSSNFIGIQASYAITGAKVIPFNIESFRLLFYVKDSIDTRLYTNFTPQINGAFTRSDYGFSVTFSK